jgi:cation diffusion facilitator family transporter
VKSGHGRRSRGSSSRQTVAVALVAGVLQTIALGIAARVTGSAALLAQAAANLADVAVQVFLLVGVLSSVRVADERHPLGHGRDRYFWSLFAAVGVFGAGILVAFDQALEAASSSGRPGSYAVGYAVLAVTVAMDALAFVVSLSSLRRQAAGRRRSLRHQITESTDPTDATVALASGVQLVGGFLAAGALVFQQRTGSAALDAVASALIGLMLLGVSIFLLQANRQLLLGRGVPPALLREMRAVVAAQPGVLDVPDLFAIVIGPATLVVDGDVTFDDHLDVPAVEAAIAQAAVALRQQWPTVVYVYLTPVASARPRGSRRTTQVRHRSGHLRHGHARRP